MVALTPNACVRLRASSDVKILSEMPVVRVLVVQRIGDQEVNAARNILKDDFTVFVTDNESYAHIVLSNALTSRIGEEDWKLHVGSIVKLTDLIRLPEGPLYQVKATGFALEWDMSNAMSGAGDNHDSPPLMAMEISRSSSVMTIDLDPESMTDPWARSLLAQVDQLAAERDSERKRRRLLERVLADVCRDLQPGHAQGLGPNALDALVQLADFAGAAGAEGAH
ncbi:hypothetical protein BD413DRAFT_609925 [Trametes elegans]|nr:hypothetical protein BD413DRAFT_609925 [Trametes elegans]